MQPKLRLSASCLGRPRQDYARKKAKSYPGILEQLLEICHKDKNLLLSLAISQKLMLILRSQSPVPHLLYGHLRE